MRPFVSALQAQMLLPLSRALFPVEGAQFDAHHAFMVRYKAGEDLGLDMHTDDSDVTVNVCLGKEGFRGAGLTFCGVMATSAHRKLSHVYGHELGRAVVHLGNQRHGADDIRSGERHNLIIWNHNHAYRNSHPARKRLDRYDGEAGPPDPQCLSYTHDRDYGEFKPYPPGKAHFAGRAWCPPRHACYDTMEPIDTLGFRRKQTPGDRLGLEQVAPRTDL